MKCLKQNIYKNILSILVSNDKQMKTVQNTVLFRRAISTYPSKSIFCLASERLISYFERNVVDVNLILDVMQEEGEDEEIITNIKFLRDNPTITTIAECNNLCRILSDYIKYDKILKIKNSFLQTLDLIEEDDDSNIKSSIDSLAKISNDILIAYNSANVMETQNTFDIKDPDGMKNVIAATKDARDSNKVMRTGIRMLNNLLSPGYLSGCLYIYAGLPGNYKSGILLESFVDACKFNEHLKETTNGKTPIVLYVTMENTMVQTVRRLWSLLYPMADIDMFTVDEAYEMIVQSLTSTGFRPIILYYGYREKSTADLENIIRSLNDDSNKVVGLFFDYIKRIRPARTDAAATASEKSELNAIMNEFKLMASRFDIPIVSGHQLNRQAAADVDAVVSRGGFNKTDKALSRSQIGTAWEVMEVADWVGYLNIENNGESKLLVVKATKQRDKQVSNPEEDISGLRHPFISAQSFALQLDINENCPISQPIYVGRQALNYAASI